jgi:hypothetical protein
MRRVNAKSAVLRVQPRAPKAAQGAKSGPLSPPEIRRSPGSSPLGRGSHADAIALVCEGLPDRVRSVRVLVDGASQNGKTTFARALCERLAMGDGVLVVHDLKFPDRPQYPYPCVSSVGELRRALIRGEPAVTCRPGVAADDAALAVRQCAEAGFSATLLLDEVQPALRVQAQTGEVVERVWAGQNLTWLCLQGGGLGGSLVQLCQVPKMVPGSLLDNLTAVVVFGTGGRSLGYAADLGLVPKDAIDVVRVLAVGECCVFLPDRDWNRVVYYSPRP